MKPMTSYDLHDIELRARALRAQAMRDGMVALKGWIARRFIALRAAPAHPRQA